MVEKGTGKPRGFAFVEVSAESLSGWFDCKALNVVVY